jgi:hypothetical protein
MSLLEFYAMRDESLAILGDVMSQCGVWVVPNLGPYEQPTATVFRQLDEDLRCLAPNVEIFLGGEFSREPPHFELYGSGPAAGKYYISPREGGPLIQVTLPGVVESSGERILTLGSIILQTYYRNPANGSYEPPGPELKKSFNRIVRVIKQHLTVHELAMKFWISPGALRLFNEGAVSIQDAGVVGNQSR